MLISDYLVETRPLIVHWKVGNMDTSQDRGSWAVCRTDTNPVGSGTCHKAETAPSCNSLAPCEAIRFGPDLCHPPEGEGLWRAGPLHIDPAALVGSSEQLKPIQCTADQTTTFRCDPKVPSFCAYAPDRGCSAFCRGKFWRFTVRSLLLQSGSSALSAHGRARVD